MKRRAAPVEFRFRVPDERALASESRDPGAKRSVSDSAGGTSDIFIRMLGEELQKRWIKRGDLPAAHAASCR